MRISFSGAAGTGKSTLVQAFKRRWPMYTSPLKTYRDIIIESGLPHSSKTSEESQAVILNWMMEEEAKTTKDSKVVFDRCSYDNLAYTLQGCENDLISDSYAALTIAFVKESLKNLDLIFWIKRDENIPIVADGLRDIDPDFLLQSDAMFQYLFHQYCENLESDVFFHKEDCPAIVMMEGSTIDDRLAFIGEFIDYKGDLIETESSILDPKNVDLLEKMLGEQKGEMANEAQLQAIIKQFKGV